ncbi:hypothetical protein LTR86_007845 [Recurvomyces mirabilis]|nr:hypothetical protein LTR86_007845 [Recurvomyces mirabilis]
MPGKATYAEIDRNARITYDRNGWMILLDDDTRECWRRIADARNGPRRNAIRPDVLVSGKRKDWYYVPLPPSRHHYQLEGSAEYLHQLLASREHFATTSSLLLCPERYYRYDHFADAGTQIRLMEVYAEHASTRLNVKMTTHDIKSSPSFIAISYEWGTSRASCLILVDGRAMLVRKNCYRVLRQVQKQGASIYYWIDAICIDQWNNAEKSKQVQLMGQVYRNAQSTAVCIGAHDASSAFLYEHLKGTVQPKASAPADDGSIMSATESVCARSYFRRLWIVQEVLLSKEIYLYCGYDVLAWDTLQKLTVGDGKDNEFVRRGNCLSYVKLALARTRGISMNDWQLEGLIDRFSTQECSDARDKIYGMLGLIAASKDFASPLPFTPDYDLPAVGVALQVIHFYLKSNSAETFTKACRNVVEVLGVLYHDSAVQLLVERCKQKLSGVIAAVLEDLRQHTWDVSPVAHQRFAGLVERHFAMCRVGGSAHPHTGHSQEDSRHALATTNHAYLATATTSSQRMPRFIDLIPDNIDSASARYRLSSMYRLVLQCPIAQSEPQPGNETSASHNQIVCTCLQDCLDTTRREGVGGPDLCLYVDAEDVLAQVLQSLKAETQASTDRTKLASNACGLQSGEKMQESNDRDPSA